MQYTSHGKFSGHIDGSGALACATPRRLLATEAASDKAKPESDMFGLNRIMRPDTVDLNEKKVRGLDSLFCQLVLLCPQHPRTGQVRVRSACLVSCAAC